MRPILFISAAVTCLSIACGGSGKTDVKDPVPDEVTEQPVEVEASSEGYKTDEFYVSYRTADRICVRSRHH